MGSTPTFGTKALIPSRRFWRSLSRTCAGAGVLSSGSYSILSQDLMRRPDSRSFCLWIILGAILVALATCSAPARSPSPQEREAQVLAIAAEYVATRDLAQAEARLEQMGLPNSRQYVALLTEEYIREKREGEKVSQLVQLAHDLGMVTEAIAKYHATLFPATVAAEPTASPAPTETPTATAEVAQALAEPTATPKPIPDTSTPTPTASPTATAVPPTATPLPPSPTPTPIPSPYVVAKTAANVRYGPGTSYPVLGTLKTGTQMPITGRNQASDWWQVCCFGGKKGWVAASVVEAGGMLQGVQVATDIPPSPTPTPKATPTPVPPTATPKPSVAYRVKSVRLRAVGEHSQRCNAGDHYIAVLVVDPAGNPVDGVRVRGIFSGRIEVTGAQGKGPGRVEFDIYRGGGDQIDIIDDAGNRISEVTRGMSADWPDFDLLRDAGYCNCKPHPDEASCKADLENKTYLFAVGHYTYEVVFERTY